MRFALLCDDPSVEPILTLSAGFGEEHQFATIVIADPQHTSPAFLGSNVKFVSRWEDLLVVKEIDAVIVAGHSQPVLEGSKQIAAAGIPLLFIPEASQGSTFIYELSLIRDDNRVPVFPMQWHRFDAAALALKHAINEGRLGRIQFLQFNRTRSRDVGSSIGQTIVDAELLPDVDLLRWLMGDYDQVTCLRTGVTADGLQMQSVVLAGRALPEANWSVSTVDGSAQFHLTVQGDQRTATLIGNGSSRRLTFQFEDQTIEGCENDTALAVINTFKSTVQQTSFEGTPVPIDREWGDLIKCYETVDATHRSIKRKRTIELHFEPMSERAIFKTQMTAIGCSVLTATLFLTLLYLGIASFIAPVNSKVNMHSRSDETNTVDRNGIGGSTERNPPLPFAHRILIGLRLLIFAPLALFLVTQILLPLARPSTNKGAALDPARAVARNRN